MPDPAVLKEREWNLPDNIILTFSYAGALTFRMFETLLALAIDDFRERQREKPGEFFSDFPWEAWITDEDAFRGMSIGP